MGEKKAPIEPSKSEVAFMYNMLKNKMSSMIFHNFKKGSYRLISKVEGKEEIYYQDGKNKLVVLIEDEEVGKRMYDVVNSLKEWGETISSDHVEMKITSYVADKYNTVQILFADASFNFENNWDQCSKLDKIQEMVSFVYGMQNNGYLMDESVFDNESCVYISDFLSYFKPNSSEMETSNGCIVKYIHYMLSGGNLDEYYEPIVRENRICAVNDFPYYMPVIKMCYNYYANGIVPDNIISVIKAEKVDQCFGKNLKLYTNYQIVGNSDLSSTLTVVESSDEYTIYEGFVKIYKEVSPKFAEFLEDDGNFIRRTTGYLIEKFSNVIINYDGNIIGYKYDLRSYDKNNNFLNRKFESQNEIIHFIVLVKEFLEDIYNGSGYSCLNSKNNFNLETDLISIDSKRLKILTIENLYNLVTDDRSATEYLVTMLFFKILKNYLENKYGVLADRNQILEKKEVRYLPPIVAKNFINYCLGKKVSADVTTNALYKFIDSDMMLAESNLVYDSNFKYNPSSKVPFTFDYEVESKYGIKLEKGLQLQTILPDNRILLTFKRGKDVSVIYEQLQEIKEEIRQKIPSLNDRYINLTDLSEIIYSPNLNSEDRYNVVGYITTPMQGEIITKDMVLGLNNREMLRYAGKLISNFGKYHINWNSIFINIISNKDATNRDFVFYCNLLDEHFSIDRSYYCDSEYETVEQFFDYLKDNGYNKNAFEGIKLSRYNLQRDLISYANSFDAYCKDHKIYYDSRKLLCPICSKTLVIIPDVSEIENFSVKVFEDEYAVHYSDRTFRGYNVKIYKPEAVNMEEIEKNVNAAIEGDLRYNQDCFIPRKKVINKEHQFIGCLYKEVVFNNEDCKDIADTNVLENLPRIMSLLRLMSQVKLLIQNDYRFSCNPFTHVFLCKDCKKQVQILNIEFLKEKGNVKNTRRWLCEYVYQTIKADSNIQLDITRLPQNDLNSLSMALEELSKSLNMYCPIHKMFYSNEHLFCPKCVDNEHIEKMEMKYVDSREISDWDHFNEGGESIIYALKNGNLAKIFREEINYAFKNRILAAIFGKKEILEQINQENHKFQYIIPKKLLVDKKNHKVIGYTMDRKVEGEPIASLSDKDFVRDHYLSRKDVLEILITVGEGIETLHNKTNIYIGDLNGRNILFDEDKNVYFLDFDGMGYKNIQPLFFTDEYIDPISRKNKSVTQKDDWYSLSVQAFHYLTYTHPFDGIYQKNGKTLDIEERMERRISLLGNHGIKAPKIAEPWNWMSEDLKNLFYTIFETEERRSIVNELKMQYNSMYDEKYQIEEIAAEEAVETPIEDTAKDAVESSNSSQAEEIIRINSKFVAKVRNPFNCNVEHIINYYSAVCEEDGNYYVVISANGNMHKVHFLNCMGIKDLLLLETYPIALAVYDDIIVSFNLQTDKEVFYEHIQYNSDHVVVNGNTLYISKKSNGENIILQVEFDSNGGTKSSKIKFLSDQETKGFLVKFNSKFMLIKQNSNGRDEIYCNSEKLCDIDYDFQDSKYNILYDDVTKLWLVVNSKGNYITIKSSNGHYKKVDIPVEIDDMKLENVSFAKGILYIPSKDCVYIIAVNNVMTTKQMECSKIMTSNSLLCNFNSNGFSAITDDKIYDICKE